MADPALTIEELSFRSGVTTRNIRAYQSRGLCPPPTTRKGDRTGYYSDEHVARLRLIDRLQQRGFSLAGIADLLKAWKDGRSLQQVMGMEAAVAERAPDDSILVTEEQLHAMAPVGTGSNALTKRLRALGLLVHEGSHYRLKHPVLMELGVVAANSGVPLNELLNEFERVRQDVRQIARRYVKLYEKFVWKPYRDAGMPGSRLAEMTEGLKQLRQLAERATQPMLTDALAEEIEAAAGENLPTPEQLAQKTRTRKKRR